MVAGARRHVAQLELVATEVVHLPFARPVSDQDEPHGVDGAEGRRAVPADRQVLDQEGVPPAAVGRAGSGSRLLPSVPGVCTPAASAKVGATSRFRTSWVRSVRAPSSIRSYRMTNCTRIASSYRARMRAGSHTGCPGDRCGRTPASRSSSRRSAARSAVRAAGPGDDGRGRSCAQPVSDPAGARALPHRGVARGRSLPARSPRPVGVKNSDHPCDLRLRPIWPPVRSARIACPEARVRTPPPTELAEI